MVIYTLSMEFLYISFILLSIARVSAGDDHVKWLGCCPLDHCPSISYLTHSIFFFDYYDRSNKELILEAPNQRHIVLPVCYFDLSIS